VIDRADTMLLVARTQPREAVEKRTQGVTLFLADPDDPAIELREIDVGIPTPEKQFEVSSTATGRARTTSSGRKAPGSTGCSTP